MPTVAKPFFRLVTVLLLALTVPVHGMAAITVGQCMALTHHDDGGGQDSHSHPQDGATGHDHAAYSHDDGGSMQGDQDSKQAHCGPCTACCASPSIAGPAGILFGSSPSNVKYAFSQLAPLGVQPDGLDRPPLAL